MVTNRGKSESGIHWAWVVLGSSFATLFVNHSIRIGAYSVLLPKMIPDLGLNMTQAGLIRTAYFFTYILFSPLMGWLTDRFGGRFVISFFCLFLGMGTFLMSRSSNLFSAILFYGIVGMGAAAVWTPIVVLVQNWFGTKRRGLAFGILSPSYALGFGLMGVILPIVVQNYGWRMGWLLLGISGLILVGVNSVLLRSDPKEVGLSPWGEAGGSILSSSLNKDSFGYRDIVKKGRFWSISISYLFISAGVCIISDFIVTYGVMELKISYPLASALISMMASAGIGGGMLLMTLSDYIGRKRSLLIIHVFISLSILFILLIRDNVLLLMGGMGFFGFFYGAIWPMYGACARDFFPKEMTGRVFGLMTIFYGLGAMSSPPLTGYLADITGTFRWSFGLGASMALIAAICIRLISGREV